MKKYQLTATQGREYNQNTGWDLKDHTDISSDLFNTTEEAKAYLPEFIKELDVQDDEVYQIDLVTVEEDEEGDTELKDAEMLDFIDKSESGYTYAISRYYGQYMIPQNKFKIEYMYNRRLTRNEVMIRSENRSHSYNIIELFNNEEEVLQWVEENPDANIVYSVVDIKTDNNE